MPLKYFEDHQLGEVQEYGETTVSEEEIITFAKKYDPQYFHIDAEAAKDSPYGGLIASGWHTQGLFMRMFCDNELTENPAAQGSPGVDDMRWIVPVRPGDTLRVRRETSELVPSTSRTDRGVVRGKVELFNQNDEVVMSFNSIGMFARRPG